MILAHCLRQTSDYPVQDNMAVTPTQMAQLAQQGIPISTTNIGLTYDEGRADLDFQPDMENLRGIDIADMWQAREDFKAKSKKAFQNNQNQ